MFTMYLICLMAWYILVAVGGWKMFEKAGEAGWKSLIPVYNIYVIYKICWDKQMFWTMVIVSLFYSLLFAVGADGIWFYIMVALGIVDAVIRALMYYNLSLSFGHGIGYFLGLYFLTPLFIIILGFDSSEYQGPNY
ncbi:MAG: hypothetical protein HUJ55_01940 [Ileibacterium sp.]|nr:hypothetical protein [Ileibacterium sp.]